VNMIERPLIQAVGIKKIYKRGLESITALQKTDLNISAGDFVVISGPSGSGKSTLLHLLGGIDRPSEGSLVVNGLDLIKASESSLTRFRRENLGFIFQFYNLLPSLNALDNVILPLLAKGMDWKEARRRGAEALEQVDLAQRSRHIPAQLSGGEQQRVAIARAMVNQPCLILADEPTGDLDSASAESILKLMVELRNRLGVTFIVATHNLALLRAASHAFELRDGCLSPMDGG